MKINSRTWIIIIIISLAIIIIRFFDSNQFQKYNFQRKIVLENSIKLSKIDILKEINIHDYVNLTNNIFTTYEKKQIDKNIYELKIYDLSKSERIKTIITTLPTSAITYIDLNNLFYIDKYKLYCKKFYSNKVTNILPSDYKIYNAFPLKNEIIFIGERKYRKTITIGFFKYNLLEKNVSLIKEIKTTNKNSAHNFLIYTGTFSKNLDYISYFCDKTSNIFIFNLNGILVNHIKTKEDVPLPEIIEFKGIYVYKRGFTFSTNIGIYINKQIIYVLSKRYNSKTDIIIDKYSLKTNKYLNSFKLDNEVV